MHCRIRVQGHLDPGWQQRFEGLRIEHEEVGTGKGYGAVT
jgi:hypothetical protein